ncbi:MAG: RNA-binding S4 domain-containing protein [Pseudomonadota bacterium]|uniref:RNA-binding S4 domain-containing protein n=1 Tax=Thermithiobacillus tepidarius TaxID=929 RepID=UPI000416BA4F|nr:RNA-binding S4 domain-containing protein [Thermithiobacillus tepidarius]
MRLDLFLKATRLIKRRTLAKEVCDAGCAQLNGRPAKAGDAVKPGDRLVLDLAQRRIEARVLALPPKQPGKGDMAEFVEILQVVDKRGE